MSDKGINRNNNLKQDRNIQKTDKNESKIVRKLEKFKTIKKNVENLNLPQIKKKDSQPKIKNYEGLNNKLMKRPEEVEITLHNEKKAIHSHHNISIESNLTLKKNYTKQLNPIVKTNLSTPKYNGKNLNVFSNGNILQKLQPLSGNNSNSLRKENNNSALCENTRNKKNMSKIQIDDFNSCLPNRPQNLINNINILTTLKSPSHKLLKKVEITNKNNHNYNTNSTNNLILNNSNSSNNPSTKPINNSPNTITLVYNNSSKSNKVNTKTLNTNDSSLQSNQLHNLSHNNNISRQNTISQNNSILNISNSQPNLISTQPSPKCVYCYKEDQNTFFRDKMEDMEKIVDNFANDPYKQLFCLFDGHGTGDVAKFAKDSFPEIFSNYLNVHKNNPEKALLAAFLKIDEDIKTHVQSENAGSTACVCYVTHEGNKKVLYVANVGDTRAVMLTKHGIKRLSYDHKCSDTSEELRVKNSGGIIFNGRVFGQLILSRALGDHSLKNCGVICTPYVNKHTICENDLYVLIASDGVWDVIKEEDLVNIFSNNSCMNTNQLAGLIVSTSLELESKDNISCILIKLN